MKRWNEMMKKVAGMFAIAPMGIALILLAGNTAPTCGEIEPLEPVCKVASDCER